MTINLAIRQLYRGLSLEANESLVCSADGETPQYCPNYPTVPSDPAIRKSNDLFWHSWLFVSVCREMRDHQSRYTTTVSRVIVGIQWIVGGKLDSQIGGGPGETAVLQRTRRFTVEGQTIGLD